MKGITIKGVLSDGSYQPGTTVEYVFGDLTQGNQPYLDDETGEPLAVATLRLMTRKDVRALQKRYTKRVADGSGRMVEEITEPEAYRADLVDTLIVEWRGLMGEDGQPMECSRRAKLALGEDRLAHMMQVAMQNEAVDASASFRQPANVP